MQIPQRLDAHGGLANGVSDIHRAPEFEKTNSHMYSLMEASVCLGRFQQC